MVLRRIQVNGQPAHTHPPRPQLRRLPFTLSPHTPTLQRAIIPFSTLPVGPSCHNPHMMDNQILMDHPHTLLLNLP
jgi:hypothetical protein